MLVAVSRRYENGVTREAFRTLQSNGRSKPAPVFTLLQVAEDAEAPAERIGLTTLANGERR
jgi:hypothetical protein